jgi:hypothetical protein
MLFRSKVNAFATQKQCFRNSKAMLSQLKSNAFATQKQCFPTLEDMLFSKGIHAF